MGTIASRNLGYRNFEKDVDRLDTSIFSGDLPPGPIGTAAWNHIHLIPPNGAAVTSYPVTVAGLLAALAAATVAGSMIWVPPGSFNTAITIPANIALVALGEKVSINGQWTLNSGVVVANIVQTQSGSSAGALSGVVGPSSGIAYMKNCSISVENSGAGDAYAINQSNAGELWLWACSTYGNASGGGSGYGARQSAGTLYVSEDGRHRGSTGKFSGTVQLFSFDDVIRLKTSTFTRLYNASDAGLTAALAAASSGDALRLPDRCSISGGPWTVPAGVIVVGSGVNSILTGSITNNGWIEKFRVVGNVTNAGFMRFVRVIPSTGTGITQATSTAMILKSWVQMGIGVTYGIDISDGYIFDSNVGTDGGSTNTGVYVHGSGVEIYKSRFAGAVAGGKVEEASSIDSSSFRGTLNADGLVHTTTGTARLNNCSFYSEGGTGYGINLSNTGLTLTDCGWTSINGYEYITFGTGDRAPDNHTHGHLSGILLPFSVSGDGAWSWFADPRAVYYNGTTYFGYIASDGDVSADSFDHATKQTNGQVVLHAVLEVDDHDNPSILVRDSDKKLLYFYSAHDGGEMYLRVSTNTEDISSFAAEQTLDSSILGTNYTYPMPVQLLGEANDPIYLFYRDRDGSGFAIWRYSKSTDGGATWSAATTFYSSASKHPYLKALQNGDSRIDFVATDQSPNNGVSSIYHFYYEGGNYYQTDGTLIGAGPVTPAGATQVYDGSTLRSWIWDIAIDENGYPVVTFVKFVSTTDHRYMYGRWNGTSWDVNEITEGGTYLYAAQPYYSGGVVLDHEDPSVVYLSKVSGGQWEIYKYVTADGGASWDGTAVTTDSADKNIRPVAIRDHADGYVAAFLKGTYTSYTDYDLDVYFIFDEVNAAGENVDANTVLVSSNDTTPGYLNGKLVAGDRITLTENNDGGNETLSIKVNSHFELLQDEDGNPLMDENNEYLYTEVND